MSQSQIRSARLDLLEQAGLIGVSADESFDRYARLAAKLLHAPVAQVNVVTADRQISKSSLGPEPWPSAREVPLPHSYCKHIVASGEPLVVEDAREHPLVRDSPATTESGIVAYAAAPLVVEDGHVLGTLCVVDFEPRNWTEDELRDLRDLAHSAAIEIELRIDAARRAGAEIQLRRAGHFQEMLLQAAGDGVYGLDLQGRATFVNPAAARMLGYTPEELIGRIKHEVIHRSRADGTSYPATECPIHLTLRDGQSRHVDSEVFWRKDGSSFPVEYTSTPIVEDGRLAGAVVTFRDISDRRSAEERERELDRARTSAAVAEAAKAQITGILESITDQFYALDREWRFTYLNARAEEFVGRSRDELIGSRIWDAFPQTVGQIIYEEYHRAMEEQVARVFVAESAIAWGRWLEIHAYPSREGLSVYCQDITERRRTEEAHRRSEERFRLMVEGSEQVFFYEHDWQHRFTYLSPSVADILGYAPDGLLGRPYDVLLVGDATDRLAHELTESALQTGLQSATYTVHTRHKEGRTVVLEITESPVLRDGEVAGMQGFARDVTERRRAEQALEASEERFRQLAENIPEVFWMSSADSGELLYVSPSFERVWGLSVQGLLEDRSLWRDSIHPEDRDRVLEIMAHQVFEPYEIEYRIVRSDGGVRWIRDRGIPVRNEHGAIVRIAGIAEDITADVEAEEALHHSEERWRALVERSADLILTLNADGAVTYASASVGHVLGYTPEELVGTSALALVHPEDLEAVQTALGELSGPTEAVVRAEFRYRHKDGSWRILVARARNLLDHPAVRGIVVNGRDATEQRRTEEQFRQAQKMEAIGRLAGGVAHDFNNLLTSIRGFAQMAADDLGDDHPVYGDLDEVIRSAGRAAALTQQLLAFSRQQVLRAKVLNLNETVGDLAKMLRRLVGGDVDFRTRLASDLGNVTADPGQIEQVIMNLVVNARDAMPEGGTLTLETQNVELSEDYATDRPQVRPGAYVVFSVSDTGHGMSREVQERIFEPFFTTKEQGKGTGLGLSTVFGIVKQSEGHVWVYSEPGQGTTFKVYLPRIGAEAGSERIGEPETGPVPTPSRAATVLLVEDESAVRTLAARVLVRAGFTVIEAQNGTEALRALEVHRGKIDLVITDMVMPGMNGAVLARQVEELYPGARVIFTSGYSREDATTRGALPSDVAFLEKPYTPDALVRIARAALGTPRANRAVPYTGD